MNFTFKIGGQAGEGIDTAGEIFAVASAKLGFQYYTYRHFPSRIRGGHTSYELRLADKPIHSRGEHVDFLVVLDEETIKENLRDLHDTSVILLDTAIKTEELKERNILYEAPITEMAQELGSKILRNTIALGISAALLHMSYDTLADVVKQRFARKGDRIIEDSLIALQKGYEYGEQLKKRDSFSLEIERKEEMMLISGNEAIALGAIAAGCSFLSAYPITPATEIMEYLAAKLPEYGGMVIQAEDEIAAINMAIGAGFAGARAMTSTSGPGLSLMTEALGLAHITETPIVIANVQRAGPATGLPTKHEQSDINQAIFSSHGDAPRIVLAPATVSDCFHFSHLAFNLAEKYQTVVIVLIDQAMGLGRQTIPLVETERIIVDRGKILKDIPTDYQRYKLTDDGISKRTIPGQENGIFMTTGDEHAEDGHIIENPKLRTAMVNKRLQKYITCQGELPSLIINGNREAKTTLIGIGSTYGPLEETLEELDGVKHIQLRTLWPFPKEELSSLLGDVETVFVIENNATAQLSGLIKRELGLHDKIRPLLKYDGVPFKTREILERVREEKGWN